MSDFKVVLPTTTQEWQRDMNIAYNRALEDLWELAINKYDEAMDFSDLDECIEELKNK